MDSDDLGSRGRRRIRVRLTSESPPPLPEVPRLLAAASEVDITPAPGLPKAGYSRNARDGNGFRTRLRARVIHLRCGTSSLAIVATDLLGGSAILQHLVAERIAGATDVPLGGLFIGATHTHGAPGQFHGTDFYNRFSSNRAGFDPDWTAFLVDRISEAVEEAVANRRPAVAGWGRAPVRGLTRNRSLPAYHRNPGQSDASADEAVNPWLDLLRVDDETSGEAIAALVTFSIHGTAVPMTTQPYNADLWSYLCTRLGDLLVEPGGRRPVVGALQGTHGDVTPALRAPAGHAEAARIGRGVAETAADVHRNLAGKLRSEVELGSALRAVDPRSVEGRTAGVGVTLPERPAVGAALVAGARENLTPVVSTLPIFRAGHGKRWSRGVHGAKWVLGSRWGQRLLLPLDGFPRVLPVHLLRIGETLLVGLPMEITTTSGRMFAGAAEDGYGDSDVRAVVSSVADEYAGYCTTEEEYSAQFYEGGHTLYGPLTQRFLAAQVSRLASELAASGRAGRAGGAGARQDVAARELRLQVRRFPPPTGSREAGVTSLGPVTSSAPGVFEWRWRGPDVVWHQQIVSVEQQVLDGSGGSDSSGRGAAWAPVPQPGSRVLDDGHGDLEVFAEGAGVFGVRWYAAEAASVPADLMPRTAEAPRYRFRLRDASSPSF